MLGLATHEPNFTIIREEFKPNQPKPCDMCGQMGNNYNIIRRRLHNISNNVINAKNE